MNITLHVLYLVTFPVSFHIEIYIAETKDRSVSFFQYCAALAQLFAAVYQWRSALRGLNRCLGGNTSLSTLCWTKMELPHVFLPCSLSNVTTTSVGM